MFKKGDKVKRIKGDDYPANNMYRNEVYTVKKCNNVRIWLDECPINFGSNYFQLIKENSNYEIY